jgi:hypothetical protein
MAIDEDIARGGEAAQVLDSPVFIAAKQAIAEGIQRQMRSVPLSNQDMHSRLIMLVQVWDQLEKYLEQIKQSGQIAQFQVVQEEERRNKFKLWGN